MHYEYLCEKCGVFEVQQKITEEPLVFCPKCKEEGNETTVKRLISASNFILKGGGWASDNYK